MHLHRAEPLSAHWRIGLTSVSNFTANDELVLLPYCTSVLVFKDMLHMLHALSTAAALFYLRYSTLLLKRAYQRCVLLATYYHERCVMTKIITSFSYRLRCLSYRLALRR
jgi:hypothetical protein